MAYIHRPIGDVLLDRAAVPVLILEGARAVGKTTTMREQVAGAGGFTFVSLVDPATLTAARTDVRGWLRWLPRPAIIDEAQLLDGLTLALKELVDELGPGTHFVLTGSASIGRTGLGGTDPLSRRSQRMTMSPLTQWEVNQQPGSIVDALFDGHFVTGDLEPYADRDVLNDMRIGGFPGYLFAQPPQTRRQIQERIRSDFAAILTQSAFQGLSLDASIGRVTLDALLRNPGGIFNASRIAQLNDLDRRTVDRYLGVFESLFLVHWLPNLATTAHRQSPARAKVHPVDVSFSIESLERAGVDIGTNRELFGQLLETHVVNQVVAATQWASVGCDAYYWRLASNTSPEVDLVLASNDGRELGIEVKASSSVDPRDFNGLRKLRDSRAGFHRGIVFYTGTAVREIEADMWAIPIAALSSNAAFGALSALTNDPRGPRSDEVVVPTSSTRATSSFDATVFLSYVHADDQSSGGRILAFARDMIDRYAFLFGHELELFIDRDDILWGENWARRLSTEIEATSFLLSIVTPRYLKSEACRAEVLAFAAAAKEASDPRLLIPLQWVDIANSDVVPAEDPVRLLINQNQYVDVTEIRRLAPGSVEYDELLERVASALHRTVTARSDSALNSRAASNLVVDQPDLMTVMERLQDRDEEFNGAVADFKAAFDAMGAVFSAEPQGRIAGTYASANALAQLGKRLAEPVKMLENATRRVGQVWQEYDEGISRVAQVMSQSPDSDLKRDLAETLNVLGRSLDLPGADVVEQQLTLMGNFSRHLQPMSRAVSGALQLLKGIQQSARSWSERL